MSNLKNKDKNNNPVLSQNEGMVTKVASQKLGSWTNLPALVIEKIYTYLDRSDRVNMSLVCKSWLSEFSEPELWKCVKFHLFKHSSTTETWPEVKFAEKFGYMFRYVEIHGELVNMDEAINTYEKLKQFLRHLRKSKAQLLSFKLINVNDFCQYLHEREKLSLFQYTLKFIKTQHNLQAVEFRNSYYTTEDGIKLLKTICNNCPKLCTLILKGFIEDVVDDNETDSNSNRIYKNLAQQFTNLKILKINYSEMVENIFKSFQELQYVTKHTTGRLSFLKMHCDGSKRREFQGIPPISWEILRKICPALKIRLTLSYSLQVRNPIELYLVENMPVVELKCRMEGMLEMPQIDLGHLIQQIISSKINESLEWLSITWMLQVDDISVHLIPLFSACLKLKTFQIFLLHPVIGVETLFESLLNNRPVTLESVYVSINRILDVDDQIELISLAEEYIPIFQLIGLNVIFTADLLH